MVQSEFQKDDSDINIEDILRSRKKMVDNNVQYNSHCNNLGNDDLSRVGSFAVGMGKQKQFVQLFISSSSYPPVQSSIHPSIHPPIHLLSQQIFVKCCSNTNGFLTATLSPSFFSTHLGFLFDIGWPCTFEEVGLFLSSEQLILISLNYFLINSFIYLIFIEYLLAYRHCFQNWGYCSEVINYDFSN